MKEKSTFEILVNGDSRQIGEDMTVADLVTELDLAPQRLAIELNLSILPRASWSERLLKAGDKLEIVHFVGGG